MSAFDKVATQEPWRRDPPQEEDRTGLHRVCRRRWGSGRRPRPRPLSDYGQSVGRSLSIPEDSIAVDPQTEDTVDSGQQLSTASKDPAHQSAVPGWPKGRRKRPVSVIGGVSFYGNSQTEEIETLLTQVRSGALLPAPAGPGFLPFVPRKLNRTQLSVLLSNSRMMSSAHSLSSWPCKRA